MKEKYAEVVNIHSRLSAQRYHNLILQKKHLLVL